eukprot:1137807-Pelagomonas_calceolata.AAC.13
MAWLAVSSWASFFAKFSLYLQTSLPCQFKARGGEALALFESRHVLRVDWLLITSSFQLASGTAVARPCSQAG